MFNVKKHAKFFKSILSSKSLYEIEEKISGGSVKNLYALLLVIREVLTGKIPISDIEYDKLKSMPKLFKTARYCW